MKQPMEQSICENCRKQAQLASPSFFVMYRSKPGYPDRVDTAHELLDLLERDEAYAPEIRATMPGKPVEVYLDPEVVKSRTAQQLENDKIDFVASVLHPTICGSE